MKEKTIKEILEEFKKDQKELEEQEILELMKGGNNKNG